MFFTGGLKNFFEIGGIKNPQRSTFSTPIQYYCIEGSNAPTQTLDRRRLAARQRFFSKMFSSGSRSLPDSRVVIPVTYYPMSRNDLRS